MIEKGTNTENLNYTEVKNLIKIFLETYDSENNIKISVSYARLYGKIHGLYANVENGRLGEDESVEEFKDIISKMCSIKPMNTDESLQEYLQRFFAMA